MTIWTVGVGSGAGVGVGVGVLVSKTKICFSELTMSPPVLCYWDIRGLAQVKLSNKLFCTFCQMYFLTQNPMRWTHVNRAFLKPNKNLGPDRWWLFVQGIRLLLAHTETEFEDKQLSCGPGWCNNSRASNIYLCDVKYKWCVTVDIY